MFVQLPLDSVQFLDNLVHDAHHTPRCGINPLRIQYRTQPTVAMIVGSAVFSGLRAPRRAGGGPVVEERGQAGDDQARDGRDGA